MGAGQMRGAVQGHDGFARAGGAGNASRAGVVALHPLALLGMQEDRPLLPREIEGALQFFDVGHYAETALGVGMIERIRDRSHRLRHAGFAARGKLEQRLGGFTGQTIRQKQESVFRGLSHVIQPLRRHAVAEQLVVCLAGEQWWLGCLSRRGQFRLHIDRHDDLLDRLADFHELRGTGLGMGFQLAPLGPVVSLVVVIDVTEQQAALRLVNDEPEVAAHPHRPEVFVLRLVELVKAHPRTRGIHLQVKGRRLNSFLLVAGQAREAVGESVGDAEIHAFVKAQRLNVGIARTINSSNNGTVNAMSPWAGL